MPIVGRGASNAKDRARTRRLNSMSRTKDRVRAYAEAHPGLTIREIQKALGLSSPSVVQFHLKVDAKEDKVKVLRAALKVCMQQLAHCLGPETEAGRVARRALDATK